MRVISILLLIAASLPASSAQQVKPEDLRLVPFPKKVATSSGWFELPQSVVITVTDLPSLVNIAGELKSELASAGVTACKLQRVPIRKGDTGRFLSVSASTNGFDAAKLALETLPSNPEGYRLSVSRRFAAAGARQSSGLIRGIQTLRQLVRANANGRSIPCVEITDWPSLRYRGFQDDITRGPSPKLSALEREAATGGYLRMNFFTYYLEHQFAFKKHPTIGPKNGSLTPSELRSLVAYAKLLGVEVFGCQQSFGHFGTILHNKEYAHLGETANILNPTLDESYRLLDDMYSEQIPLIESKFFNVCCDETDGLGTGPSKELAAKIGVGGVYAQHIRRVHDLVTGKYHKKMMMWHDIIVQHPERIKDIPKNTIVLSWGYHAGDSFDSAIVPFVRNGFKFFVCPGVSNWSRLLPDFRVSITNIHNYVRDGAKHGAMGMLNTVWVDDGEQLYPCNWYGFAWGAECSWNASKTSIESFNHRIGAVLFGEKGDRFGRAISLLAKCHSLPGYEALMDQRFWRVEMGDLPTSKATARRQARALLAVVDPALGLLNTVKKEATANADMLDYFLFSAERVKLMATRQLDYLDAAEAYSRALSSTGDQSARELDAATRTIAAVRDRHVECRDRYRELWNREKKPYALDWTIDRFNNYIGRYDKILASLDKAAGALAAGRGLPSARDAGMEVVEAGVRRSRAESVSPDPLLPTAPWSASGFAKRFGFTVDANGAARTDLPVEIDLPPGAGGARECRLFEVSFSGEQTEVPCQVEGEKGSVGLAFVAPGDTPDDGKRMFLAYLDPVSAPEPRQWANGTAVTDAPRGMKWVENDQIRLLVGPEGAHIYRWEIKALANLDITEPGEKDWAGFADIIGPYRNAISRIEITANGPALVRLKCTDPSGLERTYSLWVGVPWVEVSLDSPTAWLACYDDITVMGADSKTPGTYLFSDGETGPVRKPSATTDCQARKAGAYWSAKYVNGGPLIALITPETPAGHYVGPGSGMGAVGIDSGSAAHFVVYGGMCPDSPRGTLDRLMATLDYRRQPKMGVYAAQRRE